MQAERLMGERTGRRALSVRKSARYRWYFFFQAEDGIRDVAVTGVQTCALPISKTPTRTENSEVCWRPCGSRLSRCRALLHWRLQYQWRESRCTRDANHPRGCSSLDRERGAWGERVDVGGGPII